MEKYRRTGVVGVCFVEQNLNHPRNGAGERLAGAEPPGRRSLPNRPEVKQSLTQWYD